MPEERRDEELNALEAALKVLVPSAQVNRDRLMFEAGRAAARQRRWLWPSLAAAAFLLAGSLGTLLVIRPTVDRPVYVQVQVPAQAPAPAPETTALLHPVAQAEYLRLRDQILRDGADSLPPLPPLPPAPAPVPLRLKELLDATADSIDRPGSSEF